MVSEKRLQKNRPYTATPRHVVMSKPDGIGDKNGQACNIALGKGLSITSYLAVYFLPVVPFRQ
jgi:ABC-type phosphonate transport system ATPase subunit